MGGHLPFAPALHPHATLPSLSAFSSACSYFVRMHGRAPIRRRQRPPLPSPRTDLPAEAAHLLDTNRPWSAARLFRTFEGELTARHRLLAARAEGRDRQLDACAIPVKRGTPD